MIGIERCACGHKSCKDYWLTGVGKFVQGSGFTEDEAREIAALLNASRRPDAPSAGEWMPIETAPKDGTCILVWRADVKPGVQYCAVTAWPNGWVGLWPTAYMHYADGHEPTHWRPVPAPPQADGGEG